MNPPILTNKTIKFGKKFFRAIPSDPTVITISRIYKVLGKILRFGTGDFSAKDLMQFFLDSENEKDAVKIHRTLYYLAQLGIVKQKGSKLFYANRENPDVVNLLLKENFIDENKRNLFLKKILFKLPLFDYIKNLFEQEKNRSVHEFKKLFENYATKKVSKALHKRRAEFVAKLLNSIHVAVYTPQDYMLYWKNGVGEVEIHSSTKSDKQTELTETDVEQISRDLPAKYLGNKSEINEAGTITLKIKSGKIENMLVSEDSNFSVIEAIELLKKMLKS